MGVKAMIKTPSLATLKKYGLDEWHFIAMVARQNGVCAVCEKEPTSGRLNIDHEHVKGWARMPPEKRRIYVRGLLCYMCNRYLMVKGSTRQKHLNAAQFIADYKQRRFNVHGIPKGEDA
jgi:hypothetical protein